MNLEKKPTIQLKLFFNLHSNSFSSLENGFVLRILGRKVFKSYRDKKSKSKVTNTTHLLLCNLAVADLGNLLIPTSFNAWTLFYGRYAFYRVKNNNVTLFLRL